MQKGATKNRHNDFAMRAAGFTPAAPLASGGVYPRRTTAGINPAASLCFTRGSR